MYTTQIIFILGKAFILTGDKIELEVLELLVRVLVQRSYPGSRGQIRGVNGQTLYYTAAGRVSMPHP